jgi:HK97 family phage prohead protease
MYAPDDRFELAMTQWPTGERCQRSAAVMETAARMLAWKDAPEPCATCRQPAVAVCSGVALCGMCREQREVRSAVTPTRGVLAADVRAVEQTGDSAVLRGHAIVFNDLSVDLGGFRERIRPTAVDRLLAEGTDLRALWNHNPDVVIGRVQAGTLSVRKDIRGLRVEIHPPKWAAGYVESVGRGDISGMSFKFKAVNDDWSLEGGRAVRDVIDMHVVEVSVVTFPAYPTTDVSSRDVGRSIDLLQRALRMKAAR